ncbi:hypothetical protein DQ354_07970 [Arthrobacter sp. AQ5-06]|nr:hypothetical protein DQ354_07970 [Arthrobacter sp. AQ5-06]
MDASRAIIAGSASQIRDLEAPLSQLSGALSGLLTAIPSSVVQTAVNSFEQASLGPAAERILTESATVVSGTAQAVMHYANGDITMAQTAMRSTSGSSSPALNLLKYGQG